MTLLGLAVPKCSLFDEAQREMQIYVCAFAPYRQHADIFIRISVCSSFPMYKALTGFIINIRSGPLKESG